MVYLQAGRATVPCELICGAQPNHVFCVPQGQQRQRALHQTGKAQRVPFYLLTRFDSSRELFEA